MQPTQPPIEPPIAAESILTGVRPNGHTWGRDAFWYDVCIRGEIVDNVVGYQRAVDKLKICAENRGIDINLARAEYIDALTAEITRDKTEYEKARRAFWKEARLQSLGHGSIENETQRTSRLGNCARYCGKQSITSLRDLTPAEIFSCADAIRRGELSWRVTSEKVA